MQETQGKNRKRKFSKTEEVDIESASRNVALISFQSNLG